LGSQDFNKEQQKRFVALLIIAGIAVVCSLWYPRFVWIILAIEFAIIALLALFAAGFAFFKPLIQVSAGLSLLIFLAQSYCALPAVERVSDEALKGLLIFGLIYLSILFIKSLYKEVRKQRDKFVKMNDGKKSWLMLVLFAVFIGTFIGQLIQVIEPIVRNLCVIKTQA
jgi:hypothetical protein